MRQEVLHQGPVAVPRGIVQSRAGVVEAGRDGVDPRAVLQQALRRIDLAAPTGIDEGIIDEVLRVLAPSFGRLAERPGELARFGFEAAIGMEEAIDEVCPADPGRNPEVVDGGASFEQQPDDAVPSEGERILDWRPRPVAVDGGAGVQEYAGWLPRYPCWLRR